MNVPNQTVLESNISDQVDNISPLAVFAREAIKRFENLLEARHGICSMNALGFIYRW